MLIANLQRITRNQTNRVDQRTQSRAIGNLEVFTNVALINYCTILGKNLNKLIGILGVYVNRYSRTILKHNTDFTLDIKLLTIVIYIIATNNAKEILLTISGIQIILYINNTERNRAWNMQCSTVYFIYCIVRITGTAITNHNTSNLFIADCFITDLNLISSMNTGDDIDRISLKSRAHIICLFRQEYRTSYQQVIMITKSTSKNYLAITFRLVNNLDITDNLRTGLTIILNTINRQCVMNHCRVVTIQLHLILPPLSIIVSLI